MSFRLCRYQTYDEAEYAPLGLTAQTAVPFIASTAQQCTAAAEGCTEFTNLNDVAGGGEGIEYYSALRYCVPQNDPSAETSLHGKVQKTLDSSCARGVYRQAAASQYMRQELPRQAQQIVAQAFTICRLITQMQTLTVGSICEVTQHLET